MDDDEFEFEGTDFGTYNLVNTQGEVLQTFSVIGTGEIRIAKGEPTTVDGVVLRPNGFPGGGGGGGPAFVNMPDGVMSITVGEITISTPQGFIGGVAWREPLALPDGQLADTSVQGICQCLVCQTARGEMMDRDQVARVAAQIGSELMPDNSQWHNRFIVKSTSNPSRVYTVAQRRSDNVWGCSCPAWINRRHCKHLDDILERLAKLTAFDVTDPAVLEMLRSARTAYLDLDAPGGSGRFEAKAPKYGRALDL